MQVQRFEKGLKRLYKGKGDLYPLVSWFHGHKQWKPRFGLIGPSTAKDAIISSDARPMSAVVMAVFFIFGTERNKNRRREEAPAL